MENNKANIKIEQTPITIINIDIDKIFKLLKLKYL